jgi:hypothetical protein
MKHPVVQARSWFQATVRWAVMVEGRGIRDWEEAVYLFRSDDFDSAFQRALAIGEGGQSGGEEGIRRPRWVETRLAEVVTLDCLGTELDEELEVHWIRKPAKEKIPFEHKFAPASTMPLPSI